MSRATDPTIGRRHQTLSLLRKHGAMSRSEVAAALGVTPKTAEQFLHALRRDGLAEAGMGRSSQWRATVVGMPKIASDGGMRSCRELERQYCSVWHYASLIGRSAAARERR